MTSDYALLERPTESLILPSKRRFFPFRIPNFHQQLRNYISTADPDRIYVVVDRVVYAIHVSTCTRETIAVVPFEPKCLTAGYGWIGVGGSDRGECAFIRIFDGDAVSAGDMPGSFPAEVDSALPIDLEPPTRTSSPWPSGTESEHTRNSARKSLPEVQLHKFGSSIVNSVTIHRFPGDGHTVRDEDVMVLSNNDKTVTIYSLTRGKVVKILHHQACMNYAIISPDSKLLAAVGDEPSAYFYEITRDVKSIVSAESAEKLTGWEWTLLRHVDMDISSRFEDGCCFTVAFSPSSHLCAIGSQSGVISVFEVRLLWEGTDGINDKSAIINRFHSSRSFYDGGAVRSMIFSPMPWDVLVWIEDNGRAGIADVRQDFTRRQILHLNAGDEGVQEVRTEPTPDDLDGLGFAFGSRGFPDLRFEGDTPQRIGADSDDNSMNEQGEDGHARSLLRESLMHDLTERERLIVEFLNTARWTSRMEDGVTDRRGRPNPQPPSTRSRPGGTADGTARTSRPTSPQRQNDTIQDLRNAVFRNAETAHSSDNDITGRRASIVVPQNNRNADEEADTTNTDPQPSITVSWTASPSEIQPATLDTSRTEDPTATEFNSFLPRVHDSGQDLLSRQRSQRSTSTPRRSEPPHELPRLVNSEIRANVAAERFRRQRQIINEAHSRNNLRDHRYHPHVLANQQDRPARSVRDILNDLPDRNLSSFRDQEPGGTAGLGWGADGRTLYIATVDGIFEYQLNVHDRKTFPVVSFR